MVVPDGNNDSLKISWGLELQAYCTNCNLFKPAPGTTQFLSSLVWRRLGRQSWAQLGHASCLLGALAGVGHDGIASSRGKASGSTSRRCAQQMSQSWPRWTAKPRCGRHGLRMRAEQTSRRGPSSSPLRSTPAVALAQLRPRCSLACGRSFACTSAICLRSRTASCAARGRQARRITGCTVALAPGQHGSTRRGRTSTGASSRIQTICSGRAASCEIWQARGTSSQRRTWRCERAQASLVPTTSSAGSPSLMAHCSRSTVSGAKLAGQHWSVALAPPVSGSAITGRCLWRSQCTGGSSAQSCGLCCSSWSVACLLWWCTSTTPPW